MVQDCVIKMCIMIVPGQACRVLRGGSALVHKRPWSGALVTGRDTQEVVECSILCIKFHSLPMHIFIY